MERGEGETQTMYRDISRVFHQALDIAKEEDEHEEQLIQMIDEERLNYVGSMIRGLNDGLVELTGALAGFTRALRDPRLIATAGLITGIAASLSMGATDSALTRQIKIQNALKAGARLIVIDPRTTHFAKRADIYLQPRPGTEGASN